MTVAIFESPRYKQLGFYVGSEYRQFTAGTYKTEDASEIAVLDTITDVVRIESPEVAEKPALKTPAPRKDSAK